MTQTAVIPCSVLRMRSTSHFLTGKFDVNAAFERGLIGLINVYIPASDRHTD